MPDSVKAKIKVLLHISPSSGTLSTLFTVQWGFGLTFNGYVFDVQIKRPGATTWATWQHGVTAVQTTFTADAGIFARSGAMTGRSSGKRFTKKSRY